MRESFLRLWALFFLGIGIACGNAAPAASAPGSASPQDTIARVHWLGKRRLGVAASAYYLMRIWDLPESKHLELQTLNKLSSPPAFVPQSAAQAFSVIVRPLLSDVLQEECFFAVRQPTNRPSETVFAIRLSGYQDGFWETNLAVLAESITGIPAVETSGSQHGWVLKRRETPNLIEMHRVGDWTYIGIAQDQNSLLEDTVKAARDSKNPFYFEPVADNWLEVDGDVQRVASALKLNWSFPDDAPRLSAAVTGDGGNVLIRGDLSFPHAFEARNVAWNIPTNLIRGPLTSFTAVRGIQSLIASTKNWSDFSAFMGNIGAPPDQLCAWSQAGGPFQTFFAFPAADVSQRVNDFTEKLMNKANPWLNSRGYVGFDRMPNSDGFTWGNIQMIKPFLTADKAGGNKFIFGGLSQGSTETNSVRDPAPLRRLAGQTNLVFSDWEMTGTRVESWLYLSQITRSILHRTQIPMESAGLVWLGMVKPRLAETDTEVTQTGPNQLSFSRKGTLGLTAPELHLLVDWLESPQFPNGL